MPASLEKWDTIYEVYYSIRQTNRWFRIRAFEKWCLEKGHDDPWAKKNLRGIEAKVVFKFLKVCTSDQLTESDKNDAHILTVPGGSILPGFIEMHSHIHCSSEADAYEHITTESNETFLLRGTQAVRAALSSGVTTMRDLGSRNEVVFPLRQGISDGIIPGPRLLVAGTPITTTGGHCNMFGTEANTSAEVVKAIRNQFKLGADCIKIMSTGGGFTPGTNVRAPQYTSEVLKNAVDDADRLGLKVAAHCHAT